MKKIKPLKVTINVTKEHIEKGCEKSSCLCPIALAMKDVGLFFPSVNRLMLYAYVDKTGHYFKNERYCNTPAIAGEFIHKFDRGEPVQPFSFVMELNER